MTYVDYVTKAKPAKKTPKLEYLTDDVAIVRNFPDEMSAYRARKTWHKILSSHFLLEDERDYTIAIDCDHATRRYSLSCIFTSACGRFAYWRLVNKQAIEAEAALMHGEGVRWKTNSLPIIPEAC